MYVTQKLITNTKKHILKVIDSWKDSDDDNFFMDYDDSGISYLELMSPQYKEHCYEKG